MREPKEKQNKLYFQQGCIIRLFDVVESDENIFVVMELAEGGDLYDRITSKSKFLPEPVAKIYCYQLALAIQHLHSLGITHRDIKVRLYFRR